MKISAKLRYAVRTMCEIGDDENNPTSLSKIEENQRISGKYLKQILQPLEKVELVGSVRGKNGGYYLKKRLEDISLYEVVSTLKENTIIAPCLFDGPCGFERKRFCGSLGRWGELQKLIDNFYKNTFLSQFKDENIY